MAVMYVLAPRVSNAVKELASVAAAKIAKTAVMHALALRARNAVEELVSFAATDTAKMAVLRLLVLPCLKYASSRRAMNTTPTQLRISRMLSCASSNSKSCELMCASSKR